MIRSWNNWVFSAWIILRHNSCLQMFEGLTCQRWRWLKFQRVELRTSKLKLTGNSGHSKEDIYNNQSCKQSKYCTLLGDKHQTFNQGLSGHDSVILERIPGSRLLKKTAVSTFKIWRLGLPWWFSGKESTFQFRRHGFDPWSGKISLATEQQVMCTTAFESVL